MINTKTISNKVKQSDIKPIDYKTELVESLFESVLKSQDCNNPEQIRIIFIKTKSK